MFAAAQLTVHGWTFIQVGPCFSIWPNVLSVLPVHNFSVHKFPVWDVLTLSYLAMSGCLLISPVPCGFNQLHPPCWWWWHWSSDQCLDVFPPNWVSPCGEQSWLPGVPDCKPTARQYGPSRHSALSRGSNWELSRQQKEIAWVLEMRIETRAQCLGLIPYTKGCLSDQIKVFSTWVWVWSAGFWTRTTAWRPGWWALPLMPDFPGVLEMNMLILTISFCCVLVNSSLHFCACHFSHFSWYICHSAEPA